MLKKLKEINFKEYKFDWKKKICLLVFLFLAGSIAGFIYEEIFCLVVDNELVKRGFLYGPYLPVYGFGAIFLFLLLKRFKKKPLILFILAMLVTGIVEYITGYLLYEIYHKTWWDYTGLFLNIDGYVCLRSVFSFGIGAFLLIYIVEPVVSLLVSSLSKKKVALWSIVICLIFIIDFILTLMFRNTI